MKYRDGLDQMQTDNGYIVAIFLATSCQTFQSVLKKHIKAKQREYITHKQIQTVHSSRTFNGNFNTLTQKTAHACTYIVYPHIIFKKLLAFCTLLASFSLTILLHI